MSRIVLLLGLAALLFSCDRDIKYPNVSNVDVEIKVIPFYSDLFAISQGQETEGVLHLKEKYGDYLQLYSSQVIKVGSVDDAQYESNLMKFVQYEPNQEVLAACDSMVAGYPHLSDDLSQAFKYFKYHFPEIPVPDVYLHLSGFNQSMFIDSSFVSISVEKYLGADCRFYQWLEVPVYLRSAMTPEKMVPDVMKAMLYAWHPDSSKSDNLLSQMIYQGKVLYGVKSMMPDLPDSLLFDFTAKQLKWCRNYEADMWSYIVEKKHLYGTNRLDIQKFIGDSPFTSFYGQDSPGRAILYNAFQIVKAYMAQDESLTLRSLFENTNAQEILLKSRYRP